MPVHNADIAAIFDEIADLLEIRADNPFRIRAYRNAARIVRGYGRELKTLIESGAALPKLPGIGADLAAKIAEIVSSGHCATLDALRKQMPPAITELLTVPGLGPKRVQALNRELGVSTIAQLDAAARSKLDLPRRRQTERLLRALDQRYVNILAHPSGRLLGVREPSDIDMLRVMRKANSRGISLELNAQPERLDLDDTLCQMAREEGVLVSINSDAHSSADFANLEYGVGQARRGWLERGNVLNASDLKTLRTRLNADR